jgi:TolB-like protein/Tfp pilus assembly protein PilF
VTSFTLRPGDRLGSYEILESLGAGGMGEVYRARDQRLERELALKLLPPAVAADADRLARFEREIKSLAALNHPNIVTIYAVEEGTVSRDGADQGPPLRFFTMELVQGRTLASRIPREGLALARFFEFAIPLTDALAAAHERGITHRDLKPGNVMLTADGRLKVLDFGLARREVAAPEESEAETALMTQTGAILGTAGYMSPEQARGERATPRSDLFALGIIFFEMLTGKRPFSGETSADMVSAILRDEPLDLREVRSDVPVSLDRLVRRCLEKDASRRQQSALDLRHALESLRDELAGDRSMGVSGQGTGATAERQPIRSIAVLPLASMAAGTEDDFFADGMTDALITDLARAGGLKVISRTSVMQYKGTTRPLREIGRELKVQAVVEGSVMRSGNRVRITAQLIEAETDDHLWAQRYDRDLDDVLQLQDEVARDIVQHVDATIKKSSGAEPTARKKVDPEVYLLDLKGRHLWLQRTEESFRQAVACFEEAIERDPTYARAYVGLADAVTGFANYGLVPPAEILPRAQAALTRALELEPDSAEAYRIQAFIDWQIDFNWQAAIDSYERALELDPNSALTLYWYGVYLSVIGRFEQSFRMLDRALEMDPLSLLVLAVQGWVRYFARQYEASLPYYEKVLDLDPDFHLALWFRGQSLTELERYEEAIDSFERALELSGRTSRMLGYLGYTYGRAGREADARGNLEELRRRGESGYVPAYFPALVHAGLGEVERAIDELERAYEERDSMIRDLRIDSQWDRMRSEPRFMALMEKMGYPESEDFEALGV